MRADIYNPLADGFVHRAYEVYATLRRDDPLHRTKLGNIMVTRHADVRTALSHKGARNVDLSATPRMKAGHADGFHTLKKTLKEFLILINGEEHQRLRKHFARLMDSQVIAAAMTSFQQTLHARSQLLAQADSIDLQLDFAVPVATSFTMGLMGFPQRDSIWVGKMVRSMARVIDTFVSINEYAEIEKDVESMADYIDEIIEHKRIQPDGSLISNAAGLIDELPQEDHADIISNLILVTLASSATMTDTIGTTSLALLSHKDQLSLLSHSPENMARAADELIRYHSPVEIINRYAFEDIELDSGVIPKGSLYCCVLGSANRDESVFENAAELDLSRPKNPHLGFAFGPHTCIGNHAAKYELSATLEVLSQHLPDFRMANDRAEWRQSSVFRGLEHLEVVRI
ncbi:MAG: cytochrome P450 [Lentimonas sp.]